jgi:hypothetical protein
LSHYAQAADLGHCSIDLLEERPVRFNARVNEPCSGVASGRANASFDQCIDSIEIAPFDAACHNVAL